ncbi:conserved hypothetical protein [Aeromonas veronii]|uniref:Uncharacterized protein n=1 Tax=Aeromonas veronii TaxID=654 RepID=A0A653KUK2_AERVE|nr:conserved hypothetical protein [Aeromonas veronii]
MGHRELYALTFSQGTETVTLNGAEVNENVRAVFLLDEAKTFGFVEKLNGTGDHVRHIF